MNMDKRIARINELYHKSQREGLTDEEKEEQARLRKEYAASVRANLRGQLNNITIEYSDGKKENLGEKFGRKNPDPAFGEAGKKEIRQEILKLRKEMTQEEREKGTILLTERILGHQWYYRSECLLCFVSYGSEIDTSGLISEALKTGKKVYVPKVNTTCEKPEMGFFRIRGTEELRPGYQGIPEPQGVTEEYEYSEKTAKNTLLVMPGVAFDKFGNRLGYGAGFYDRYLADKPALQLRTIGVGYRCQLVDKIPAEETDVRPYQMICV